MSSNVKLEDIDIKLNRDPKQIPTDVELKDEKGVVDVGATEFSDQKDNVTSEVNAYVISYLNLNIDVCFDLHHYD